GRRAKSRRSARSAEACRDKCQASRSVQVCGPVAAAAPGSAVGGMAPGQDGKLALAECPRQEGADMPIPKVVGRWNKAGLNRLTRHIAPWLPGFGVIVHHGRRSGRRYQTPVNVFST